MTAVEPRTADAAAEEDVVAAEFAGRYRSERGGYEIYVAPDLASPMQSDELSDDRVAEATGYFEYSGLVDDQHDEESVRTALGDMIRAIAPGNIVTPLFNQEGASGMSLVHAWFGPHFPLFRHSHPRFGDCLYYIVAGSAVLGSRVLKPGDGFFVPNGMPYKYRAGPDGVEILEFRAGGGIDDAAVLKLHEASLESIERITATATELHDQWTEPPAHIGETPNPTR
jgi:hypothetical protein